MANSEKTIIGNYYYPQDNSWVGIYDENGKFHEGGQLCGRGAKIQDSPFPMYETVSSKCEIISEPFLDEVSFLGRTSSHPFVKVRCHNLIYRVLWNPAWMSTVSLDSPIETNLEKLSTNDLADLAIEIQRILKSRE